MSKIYNRAIFIEKAPPYSGPSLVTNISTSAANSIIGYFAKRVIHTVCPPLCLAILSASIISVALPYNIAL